MLNAPAFEERSVTKDRRLLVVSIHRQTLFSIYVHHKMGETEMMKVVISLGVCLLNGGGLKQFRLDHPLNVNHPSLTKFGK
jgi:hypothetical protein